MAKLERKQQKIFAVNSSDTAGDGTSIYGTPSSGTVQYSKDVEVIQNSNKWELGQASALIGAGIPAMEDHNSLFYVATRQLKYIYQEGIPEYLATETYYKGSICKTITIDGDKVASQLWFSKIDNNINHSPTEDTENEYWAEFKGSGGGGGSYSGGLFDIITKDHEVIDDNIKLLGSTINKTNYEKFYNICKEEYEAITNQKLYTFHYIDYADRGTPSNISNYGYKDLSTLGNTKCTFSNGAYFQFMDNLDIPQYTTWEFNAKIRLNTGHVGVDQIIFNAGTESKRSASLILMNTRRLQLTLSSNSSSWNIRNGVDGVTTLQLNTDYYIKLIYNGSNYRVLLSNTGEFSGEEIEDQKVEISTPIYNNQADDSKLFFNQRVGYEFGASPYVEFDMKYYSIKVGDNFVYTNEDWYLTKNSNGHIYYDATKQDIVDMVDEEYTENGVSWYYGINTTNETVKLPRNDYNFVNQASSKLGDFKGELPNIRGWTGLERGDLTTMKGAYYYDTSISGPLITGNSRTLNVGLFSASKGQSITTTTFKLENKSVYKDNGKVIPTGVGVYVYMVVNDNNE